MAEISGEKVSGDSETNVGMKWTELEAADCNRTGETGKRNATLERHTVHAALINDFT